MGLRTSTRSEQLGWSTKHDSCHSDHGLTEEISPMNKNSDLASAAEAELVLLDTESPWSAESCCFFLAEGAGSDEEAGPAFVAGWTALICSET